MNYLHHWIYSRLESSTEFILLFAWLSIIGYPLFYVLYFKTEILWLNAFGTGMGLLLLITYSYKPLNKNYLMWVWILYLIFNLPFNFTSLLVNVLLKKDAL